MNNPAKQKQLTALLEASRHMLECASTSDWESVDELQGQCQELSKDLFSKPVTVDEAPAFANAIKEILKINESIMSLGASARETCLKNVGDHKHNYQAIREYTANAD